SAIPALHERAILAVRVPITDGEARRGVRTRNRREGGERRGWVGRWDDHPHLEGSECDCHLRTKRSRGDGSRNRIASRSHHTSWIHGCPLPSRLVVLPSRVCALPLGRNAYPWARKAAISRATNLMNRRRGASAAGIA